MREAERNMGVLDGRLAEVEWLAGSDYSIADVATYGSGVARSPRSIFSEAPHFERGFDAVSARPAIARALIDMGAAA